MEDLLDEMTPWNAQERLGAFRSFLHGALSLIHVHVLTILEVQGPLSMSKLAEELDVSVASATGIVTRMEQRGLVKRQPRRYGSSSRLGSCQPNGAARCSNVSDATEGTRFESCWRSSPMRSSLHS